MNSRSTAKRRFTCILIQTESTGAQGPSSSVCVFFRVPVALHNCDFLLVEVTFLKIADIVNY